MGTKTASTSDSAAATDLAQGIGASGAEPAASSGTRRRPAARVLPPPRPVVLVVDDSPTMRSALQRWLKQKHALGVCSAENPIDEMSWRSGGR